MKDLQEKRSEKIAVWPPSLIIGTGGYSLATGAVRIGALSEGFPLLVLVPGTDHTSKATVVIDPVLFFCAELDVKQVASI